MSTMSNTEATLEAITRLTNIERMCRDADRPHLVHLAVAARTLLDMYLFEDGGIEKRLELLKASDALLDILLDQTRRGGEQE